MTEAQSNAFEKLKPVCVELSQIALQHKGKTASPSALLAALEKVYQVLADGIYLNSKLADYVFFPLSYIFRESSSLPSRSLERALQCLDILIARGWQAQIGAELCKQLLLLLTFLAEGSRKEGHSPAPSDETRIVSLNCLASLFHATPAGISEVSQAGDENLPITGHLLSVILTCLTDSPSRQLQLAAAETLGALIPCLANRENIRNFLPGIISSLTKTLQPSTKTRRPWKVLVLCLQAVADALRLAVTQPESPAEAESLQAWLKATAAQLKLALSNIVKVRTHERSEVRHALLDLCMMVLQECKSTLSEASTLMLETSIVVCSKEAADGDATGKASLVAVLTADTALIEDVKSIMYTWLTALPRIMQSNDETTKKAYIAQVWTAYQLLAENHIEAETLNEILAQSIRESVKGLLSDLSITSAKSSTKNPKITMALTSALDSMSITEFKSLPTKKYEAIANLSDVEALIRRLGTSQYGIILKRTLVESLSDVSKEDQLTSLWITSQLSRSTPSTGVDFDEFLVIDPEHSEDEELNQVVYEHCLGILSEPAIDDETDWRLQAVALELVAAHARRLRADFRSELVDALYPVLDRMGSGNVLLREHAITCLNIIWKSAGYTGADDLITANVDYLVNSIAVRLNTFDISPQSPQILLIMLEMCGPKLIPFLDDVVESIFSALASYHGYPRLVETLFNVLGAVVDQESYLSQEPRAILAPIHVKVSRPPIAISQVVEFIKAFGNGSDQDDLDFSEEGENQTQHGSNDTALQKAAKGEVEPPAKTYTMVQSIARLSQHYLTHESPNIRLRLLKLIGSGCLVLCQNENEFLPLINDVWPVVMKRLYDPEPFVSIAAAETLSKIFETAGDFVSSRMETEWQKVMSFYRKKYAELVAENRGKGGRGEYSTAYKVWDAVVEMLVQLCTYVPISVEMEDDLFDILKEHMEKQKSVKVALELINADAVWLEMQRKGLNLEPMGNRPLDDKLPRFKEINIWE